MHTAEYLNDFLHCRLTPRTAFSEFPLTEGIVRAIGTSEWTNSRASVVSEKPPPAVRAPAMPSRKTAAIAATQPSMYSA